VGVGVCEWLVWVWMGVWRGVCGWLGVGVNGCEGVWVGGWVWVVGRKCM
jgi:hypothetical protein